MLERVTLGTHVKYEEENTLRERAAIPSADPQEEILMTCSTSKPSSDCPAQSEQTLGVLFEQRRKQNCHQDQACGGARQGSQTKTKFSSSVRMSCL